MTVHSSLRQFNYMSSFPTIPSKLLFTEMAILITGSTNTAINPIHETCSKYHLGIISDITVFR